jgi:hypothetical protein
MKTAMQELIELLSNSIKFEYRNELVDALKKEKEQIIDAGHGGFLINFLHREKLAKMSDDELRDSLVEDTISYGEEYYNQTYNQTNVGNDGFEFDNSSTIPPPKTNNLSKH